MALIELEGLPGPVAVDVALMDFGMVLKPSSGAAVQRINRAGSRYRVTVAYPPMGAETAGRFVARLNQAKREGLRIDFPLLGRSQGAPGAPVVNGADPTGTTLPVRGLTPGYAVREGYWLTLIAADGARYLHCAAAPVRADAAGDAELQIEPPIRAPLADGSIVLLARPTIEGVLVEDLTLSLGADRLVRGGAIAIEEAA